MSQLDRKVAVALFGILQVILLALSGWTLVTVHTTAVEIQGLKSDITYNSASTSTNSQRIDKLVDRVDRLDRETAARYRLPVDP
jgi:hypothetical protein